MIIYVVLLKTIHARRENSAVKNVSFIPSQWGEGMCDTTTITPGTDTVHNYDL